MTAWTDGACSGNPGPGGYGVILEYGDKRRELSEGYRRTTNNRMEMRGVIAALAALRYPCEVTIVTDSKYVVDSVTKRWVHGWRSRGWKKSDGNPALNADLWQEMLDLLETHKVKFQWVRGHAGHAENERCDELAVAAAKSSALLEDSGFKG
ncbi:MAG: ribonuclease HI [Chthonomonas sp.]|nr:ribonuclease HI [Chthonomonas sp.]